MVFSCFCSNKKYLKDNVYSPCKIVQSENKIKILNPISHEIEAEKEFQNTIITNCIIQSIKYTIVCTKNKTFVLDENLSEIHSIQFDDEILCSSSEKFKSYFYIGFKSGRVAVFAIRKLETKVLCFELWNFYCFKPVYNLAIHVEIINGEKKRNVFAGYSRWDNKALQKINI